MTSVPARPRSDPDTPDPREEADGVPAVASARHYLRDAMPAIYRRPDSDFAMRFLYALERVLDTRVAILDSLAAYLQPRLAPEAMVEAMAQWLGLELDDAPAGIPRRKVLLHANSVARHRGTRKGLELAFDVAVPDLRLRVEDRGRVVVLEQADAHAPEPSPGFDVRCEQPLQPPMLAAVEWLIARQLPLGVRHSVTSGPADAEPAR